MIVSVEYNAHSKINLIRTIIEPQKLIYVNYLNLSIPIQFVYTYFVTKIRKKCKLVLIKIKQIIVNYNNIQDNIQVRFYRNPVYRMSSSKVYRETTFF